MILASNCWQKSNGKFRSSAGKAKVIKGLRFNVAHCEDVEYEEQVVGDHLHDNRP